MLTITGSGNLTRTPELRNTNSGKAVTTVSVACQGRNRDDEPTYVDLIVWEAQAEAAVKYLIKGRSVSFSGRPEVRVFKRSDGEPGGTLEIHGVDIEYGAKARSSAGQPSEDGETTPATEPQEAMAA